MSVYIQVTIITYIIYDWNWLIVWSTLEMKPFSELKHFGKYDVAIATVKTPFDIGIPFSNPICLYPMEKVGIESDWDGEVFSVLGT